MGFVKLIFLRQQYLKLEFEYKKADTIHEIFIMFN